MKLNNYLIDLIKDKDLLLLGLGREGLSTLERLVKAGTYRSLTVADGNEAVKDLVYSNEMYKNKEFYFNTGKNYLKDIENYDIVFKSPGIVLPKNLNPNNILLTSQMQIFTEVFKDQLIGITGTKGKSTTASLIYHILKSNNKDCFLAGNIGVPVFDIADKMNKDSIAVAEMSCHQLEYMTVSPHIATINNLHQEHLDHYGSYEAYCNAKFNIVRHQNKEDYAILEESVSESIGSLNSKIIKTGYSKNCAIEVIDEDHIRIENEDIDLSNIKKPLHGKHNTFNIAIALFISKLYGIDYGDALLSIESYSPLSHRLEYFGKFSNIDFYDDSISTIGSTAICAAESIGNCETLIIGGMDRGISYEDLKDFILKTPDLNFVLMGSTGHRIYRELETSGRVPSNIYLVKDLIEAVHKAFEITEKDRACILSPAAASYDEFKNFEERGDIFKKLVTEYKSF